MKDKLIAKCICGNELIENGKKGEDDAIICPKCYANALANIIELKACLIDMLEQFGANYSMSCIEDACALLNHPRTKWDNLKPKNDDCCYCRNVVYDKDEAKRRRKEKLNFVDRTK